MALNIIPAEVIGIRSYSFDGRDGKPVVMSQVYAKFADKRTEGLAACSFSLSERKLISEGIGVGSEVRICFADKRWEYVSA